MRPKYTIITITRNALHNTVNCIESIFRDTKDFELIVVDNGSTDGTVGYLKDLADRNPDNVKIIFNRENSTYAKANNQGLKYFTGEYVIFLNNDTIVSTDWLERMRMHIENVQLKNIGMVGPVSCMSNGRQMVGKQNAEQWYNDNRGHWIFTGILFGWCIMAKREVIDKIGGFDERFENSHEDNDLCLRAQLSGYRLIIAGDTYIDHIGQGTFRNEIDAKTYIAKGYENRERYHDKWYNPAPKKLVAVYRTMWGKHLERSLEQTSKFADSIIIHFCRAKASDECIAALRAKFPKIVNVGIYDGVFQEDYERNWLLQEALKLNAEGKADWCISIDDDEIYEDKFIDRVQKMMNPRNPEVMGYWCQWRTIWKEELGVEYFRMDSTFGKFSNYRFFRLIQGQEIMSAHVEGHHCGSAPLIPGENLQWSNIRVKHLGYDTPEQRQKKYEFYQENDHFKTRADIGNDDYSHLISKNVVFEKYNDIHGISLVMMIKNEEDMIIDCLEHVQHIVDEYIIVDTGSTDKTIELVEHFAKYSIAPVKLFHYPWCDNYSRPRNYGKTKATQPWILHLDADERMKYEDIKTLFYISESDVDLVIFPVLNYLEKFVPGKKQSCAPTESVRLFRNIPELYYSGIIHETLDDAYCALEQRRIVAKGRAPFNLHHHGYLRENERVQKKLDYYEILNNKQIEITEGKDPRPYFNLALHYMHHSKLPEALASFQKALELNPNFYHANQQMAILNLTNAMEFLKNTLKNMPQTHPNRGDTEQILTFLSERITGFKKVGQCQ